MRFLLLVIVIVSSVELNYLNFMKFRSRIVTILAIVLAVNCPALGQDAEPVDTTKIWTLGAKGAITFTQQSFTNWAAGGINSLSLAGFLGFSADYNKNGVKWENDLEMAYGFIDQQGRTFQKTDDKLRYRGNLGFQISRTNDRLFWSNGLELLTQFADGFNPDDDSTLISTFMAPGYIVITTGLEYKPVPFFSINYAPLAGKITVVANQELANQGRFGVEPAVLDTAGNIIQEGKKIRTELGTALSAQFKKDIAKNVNLESKLGFFTNYQESFGNIDVNWEVRFLLKVNDWLSTNLFMHLLYDDDVKFPVKDENGHTIGETSKVQFKQIFGIGLTYSVSNRRLTN